MIFKDINRAMDKLENERCGDWFRNHVDVGKIAAHFSAIKAGELDEKRYKNYVQTNQPSMTCLMLKKKRARYLERWLNQ